MTSRYFAPSGDFAVSRLREPLGKIRLRECERRHFFLFPITNVTAVPRTRPLNVHQQKRQVENLSFLLVHLRGLEPRTH